MSFLKKLFGGKKAEKSAPPSNPEHAKMIWASDNHCWCAALWLSVKALKADPDSSLAKDIIKKSIANSSVGLVTITEENRKKMASVTKLLQRRKMNLEEANFVADTMVSVYYMKFLIEKVSPFMERFNNNEIKWDRRIEDSDLDTAEDLAKSLWNEMLPDQKVKIKWKSLLGAESESIILKNITAFKNSLATILQANSPSDWQKTCKQVQEHLKHDSKMAAAFGTLANNNYSDNEFMVHRDEFEQTFSKEIAQMMQMQNLREPIIEL